jgi:hypothetical protein
MSFIKNIIKSHIIDFAVNRFITTLSDNLSIGPGLTFHVAISSISVGGGATYFINAYNTTDALIYSFSFDEEASALWIDIAEYDKHTDEHWVNGGSVVLTDVVYSSLIDLFNVICSEYRLSFNIDPDKVYYDTLHLMDEQEFTENYEDEYEDEYEEYIDPEIDDDSTYIN